MSARTVENACGRTVDTPTVSDKGQRDSRAHEKCKPHAPRAPTNGGADLRLVDAVVYRFRVLSSVSLAFAGRNIDPLTWFRPRVR